MIRIDSEYKFLGDSVSGTAVKNSTTDIDYKMPENYVIYGAEMLYCHATRGDYVSLQVVDKDNILGYGAGLVLHEWIVKWYVDPTRKTWSVTSDFGGTILKDLYIRVKYTSVDTETDTDVKLNFFFISKE